MGTDGFPTSSARIDHAPGRRSDSCCWELFDRAGFAGRMLRLCPGSYSRSALRETISAAVKSARLVENPKTKVRRQRARFNEVITPEEARFGALFHHLARSRLYYHY